MTHRGMGASMDAGGAVDQASAETCAMKSKERAANIPATTLRQCDHPAHSWKYAGRRKGLSVGRRCFAMILSAIVVSIRTGNGSSVHLDALQCGCARKRPGHAPTSSCCQTFQASLPKFISGKQIDPKDLWFQTSV